MRPWRQLAIGLSRDLDPQRREAREDLLSERLMREGGLHAAVGEHVQDRIEWGAVQGINRHGASARDRFERRQPEAMRTEIRGGAREATMTDDDDNPRVACEHCNGTGVFAGKPCYKCGGHGFNLKIPADKPP